MPIPITRLDNVFPATWETIWGGVHPEPFDPYIDSETRVRPIEGQDPINYFTSQRFIGDLFKRDLIQSQMLRRLVDYLAARQGYLYNIPSVTLPPNSYIPIGAMMATEQVDGYYLAAYILNVRYGQLSDIEIRIVDQDTQAVLSAFAPSGTQNLRWIVSASKIEGARGPLVDNFEIRLYNKGATAVITAQASVVLSPKLNWDDVGGSSSYSGYMPSSLSEYTPDPLDPLPSLPATPPESPSTGAALRPENNLSDLSDPSQAIENLKLLSDPNFLSSLWRLMAIRDYPVGAVWITTSSEEPAAYFGFGTWERYAAGRAIVGVNPSDQDFDAAGKVGGSKTVTLTVDQIPSHSHEVSRRAASLGGTAIQTGGGGTVTPGVTGLTGGGQPHSNLQPYIAVHVWRRIQ